MNTDQNTPEKKDKFLSFRVSPAQFAAIEEERAKTGHKTLSAFAIDRMTGKTPSKAVQFADISRLYTDLEDSLDYAKRLEKRVDDGGFHDLAAELAAEIQHFKIFVANKAETLLLQAREAFNKNQNL